MIGDKATRIIALSLGALLLGFIAVSIGTALFGGHAARVQAKIESNRADAAISTASDAANTVAEVASSDAAIDAVTQENERAIRSAPGAHETVDAGVHDAGVLSLCRYAAYRSSKDCLQFSPAK